MVDKEYDYKEPRGMVMADESYKYLGRKMRTRKLYHRSSGTRYPPTLTPGPPTGTVQ